VRSAQLVTLCLWQAASGTGGALHVEQIQSYFILSDVFFGSNRAAEAGGAMWAASSLYGTLDISNCSFSGNQVRGTLHQG
jgi:hypothetical protein